MICLTEGTHCMVLTGKRSPERMTEVIQKYAIVAHFIPKPFSFDLITFSVERKEYLLLLRTYGSTYWFYFDWKLDNVLKFRFKIGGV